MHLVVGALSAVFAIAPILVLLWLVWWLDRYDREPIWLVVAVFCWGAVGGTGLSLFGATAMITPLQSTLSPERLADLTVVLIAPLVEEPAKALVLLVLALSRHFDNTTDGFVYGTAAGLGFAMTENFLYFISVGSGGDWVAYAGTVVVRTVYSALMHACATSVVGAAVGFAKLRGWRVRLTAVPAGLVTAMAIHALWNGLLMADERLGAGGRLVAADFVLFWAEFLLLFAIFQLCLLDERVMIRAELAREDHLIPPVHVPILASYVRRTREDWLPAHIDQEAYVVAATTLAFRKHQSAGRDLHTEEISELRAAIDRLLRPPQDA